LFKLKDIHEVLKLLNPTLRLNVATNIKLPLRFQLNDFLKNEFIYIKIDVFYEGICVKIERIMQHKILSLMILVYDI